MKPVVLRCYCLCLPWSGHGSPCSLRLWHCNINLLSIREQLNARRLAPQTVFSGRGSRAAGRGDGILWFLFRQGP